MSACVFPGSFDPITRGHFNLIQRASGIFDSVTVTVMINRNKIGCIPFEERVQLIRKVCSGLKNVKVELWSGLLSDYMREHPGSVVLRGVRSGIEFEQEKTASELNKRMNPSMETVFMPAAEDLSGVSSSAIREVASFGGDFSPFVPDVICEELKKWLQPFAQKK